MDRIIHRWIHTDYSVVDYSAWGEVAVSDCDVVHECVCLCVNSQEFLTMWSLYRGKLDKKKLRRIHKAMRS